MCFLFRLFDLFRVCASVGLGVLLDIFFIFWWKGFFCCPRSLLFLVRLRMGFVLAVGAFWAEVAVVGGVFWVLEK